MFKTHASNWSKLSGIRPTLQNGWAELPVQPSACEFLLKALCLHRQILSTWLDGRLSSGPNSKQSRREEQATADGENVTAATQWKAEQRCSCIASGERGEDFGCSLWTPTLLRVTPAFLFLFVYLLWSGRNEPKAVNNLAIHWTTELQPKPIFFLFWNKVTLSWQYGL